MFLEFLKMQILSSQDILWYLTFSNFRITPCSNPYLPHLISTLDLSSAWPGCLSLDTGPIFLLPGPGKEQPLSSQDGADNSRCSVSQVTLSHTKKPSWLKKIYFYCLNFQRLTVYLGQSIQSTPNRSLLCQPVWRPAALLSFDAMFLIGFSLYVTKFTPSNYHYTLGA